jgi:hypothetical protein
LRRIGGEHLKNTVIKGDGTSRKLKAPSSLPESFSEWRTQLLAGNATLDIALNPDGCDTVGTPLSKSNLLTDETKEALGLTSDDPTINEALKLLGDAQPIIGTTPPTTSTVGVVGQEYIDAAAKLVYHCTAAAATGYTWISADKNLQDTKQDKATAITTSNIASQTVNRAKYATDGVAVGTPVLRNQYFSSTESTPTVNGQICWVYG